MNIAMITLHRVHNIGSALQSFALFKVLTDWGNKVEVIDYRRSVDHQGRRLFSIFGRKDFSPIKRVLSFLYKVFELTTVERVMNRFYKSRLKLTHEKYGSYESLKANPPNAEVFVTGSDQVWNSNYNQGTDKAYFLDFAPKGKRRISYAASFGFNSLPESEIKETRELINKYDSLALREDSGVKIINKLGRDDAQHVLDPTLLLTKNQWHEFAKDMPVIKEKYLLLYSVEGKNRELTMSYAKKIAKEKNLKIYQVSHGGFRQKFEGVDKAFYFASPERFISLFRDAEFTVVSSFHGTVFSIAMNKSFISVVPDRFSSRAASLLKIVGLTDRMVSNKLDLKKACKKVNFKPVNGALNAEREKSLAFLRNSIVTTS